MSKNKEEVIYGVDFGGKNYSLCCFKTGDGCKVLENATFPRRTPAILVFGENELLFGKSGLNNLTKSNYSVIRYIKDLFLRKSDYIEMVKCFHFPKSSICSNKNKIEFKIKNYSGIPLQFISYEVIMSLFIYNYTSLLPRNCHCFHSVPLYYNEAHNRIIKELYELHSNIENRCIETVPEYLCSSLTFGYENNNNIMVNNENKIVLIIDMGYINTYVTLNRYTKNKCEIINTVFDDCLGGRIIDKLLIDYIIGKIKEEKGVDVRNVIENNNKKYNNVLKVMNNAKEKLSANGADTISIVIDNLFDYDEDGDDEDYNGTLSIEELNKILIEDQILNRLLNLVRKSIQEGRLSIEEKKKLEISIIGGSLRTKLFQTELCKLLKEIRDENEEDDILPPLNLTLNMDEAVCSGCVYYGLYNSGIWRYEIKDNKKIINESKNRDNELYITKNEIDIDSIRESVLNIIHPHLVNLLYLHIRNDMESYVYNVNREMKNIPSNIPIDNINTNKDEFLRELKKKNSKYNDINSLRLGFEELVNQLKDVKEYLNTEHEGIISKCEKYNLIINIPNLINQSKRVYKTQIDQIIKYENEYLYYKPTEDDISKYKTITELIKKPPMISLPLTTISSLKIDGIDLMNEYNNRIKSNSEYSLKLCEESFLLHNYFLNNGFHSEFYRNCNINCFSGCNTMYRIIKRIEYLNN